MKCRVRSTRQEEFYKKVVLKNFTRFTGKRLCQSLFFNKVADLGGLVGLSPSKKKFFLLAATKAL